ncbi:elongator complex protein 3 [Desulfosarcina ovata]|uniref:Radical SAM protein n=1 Tax=Desulfosarcina ovata subsp. ovata TaxID=2752305 RepID=A0A5K8ADY6_9BACT|nr:radical SAM protein [Desulfosarcina ovata]BBO90204.1 radical SAM protein [Desulfosarcina ovata subsp. ovata]
MKRPDNTAPVDRHLIIPLFIPHLGCPHQCVFCNQRTITGATAHTPSTEQIRTEVKRFLRHAKKRYASVQISFFGGNFLGLAPHIMKQLLDAAVPFVQRGDVNSLRFSTRPDTVSHQTLDRIGDYPVSTVELGVQSMNDNVLRAVARGHQAADTVTAARLVKERGYQLGLQMMVGLPGDDNDGALATARRLVALKPDFIRIYPTLVLAGSPLADLWRHGRYQPMALDACVTLVKKLFLLFNRHQIPVVRMGLQASDGLADGRNLLAGPYHPAFGHLVHGEIVLDAIQSILADDCPANGHLSIVTHPKMVSRVQGLNKRNLRQLQERYPLSDVVIIQDENFAPNQIRVGRQTLYLDT